LLNVIIMWIGVYVRWWTLLMVANDWTMFHCMSYLLVLVHLMNIF